MSTLTVGQLRKELVGLSDDTPIEVEVNGTSHGHATDTFVHMASATREVLTIQL